MKSQIKFNICILSSKRPYNVKRFPKLDATWYVGKGEESIYRHNGAEKIVESGGLVESRNRILKDSWDMGAIAITIEDDLKKIYTPYMHGGKFIKKQISLLEGLDLLLLSLEKFPQFYLAGVAPTANLFFYSPEKPHSFAHFIVGSLIAVKPCDLLFDKNLRLKEDYDYTLQHIKKYGGAVRNNMILADFEHRKNKGGAVDYRTSELEQTSIKYLKQKWGTVIKDNKRRPNEILMRIPNQPRR